MRIDKPKIDDQTNSAHDHADAEGGGKLPQSSITDLEEITITDFTNAPHDHSNTANGGGIAYQMDYLPSSGAINVSLSSNNLDYISVTSGTGDLTYFLTGVKPTVVRAKLSVVENTRGTDATLVFPTADIVSDGITYEFHCTTASIEIPNGETIEISTLPVKVSATRWQIRINSGSFSNISS